MKHVDRVLEAHRVNSSVCVARVGRCDFEHGPAAETLHSLYARVFFAPLSGIKRLPNVAPRGGWKSPEIPSGRSYPLNRLRFPFHLYHYTFMCIFCQQVSMSNPSCVERGDQAFSKLSLNPRPGTPDSQDKGGSVFSIFTAAFSGCGRVRRRSPRQMVECNLKSRWGNEFKIIGQEEEIAN
jgi:hypothetical protein